MWVVVDSLTPGRRLHLPGRLRSRKVKRKTWTFATKEEAEAFEASQPRRLEIFQQSWLPGFEPKEGQRVSKLR